MKTKLPFCILFCVLSCFSASAFAINDAMKIKIANSQYSDEAVVRFLTTATDTFDNCCDSWKLFSQNTAVPNIFTKTINGNSLAINALPSLIKSYFVNVYLRISLPGTYAISSEEIGAFSPSACIIMKDNVTGIYYNLRSNAINQISLPVISQNDSPRFTICFSLPALVQPSNATCISGNDGKVTLKKCTGNWQYSISDSVGNLITSGPSTSDSVVITGLYVGSYVAVITSSLSCTDSIPFVIHNSSSLTSINNLFSNGDVKIIFSENRLLIEAALSSNDAISLRLTDISGNNIILKEYAGTKNFKTSIDISNLSSGIYIVSVQANSFRTVQKLMIAH